MNRRAKRPRWGLGPLDALQADPGHLACLARVWGGHHASPDPDVLGWYAELPEDDLFLSALTTGELARGLELLPEGARRESLRGWMAGLVRGYHDRILPVDTAVAVRWGERSARCRQAGRAVPVVDALIAATALVHGLTVVTRHTADFAATGVALLDPWVRPLPGRR